MISPQLGQGNFVASVPGAIILWHEVQVGTVVVAAAILSLISAICLVKVSIFTLGLAYIRSDVRHQIL